MASFTTVVDKKKSLTDFKKPLTVSKKIYKLQARYDAFTKRLETIGQTGGHQGSRQSVQNYVEYCNSLHASDFWKNLTEKVSKEQLEQVTTIEQQWAECGRFAHFKTRFLFDLLLDIEQQYKTINSLQKAVANFTEHQNDTQYYREYADYLQRVIKTLDKEKKRAETALLVRFEQCIIHGKRVNPAQRDWLEESLKHLSLKMDSGPACPSTEKFPWAKALVVLLQGSKRAQIRPYLRSLNDKPLTVVHQSSGYQIVPEALQDLIPAKLGFFSFLNKHLQFRHTFFSRHQDALYQLIHLATTTPTPSWSFNQAEDWKNMQTANAQWRKLIGEISNYPIPKRLFKKSQQFITRTQQFCKEQHREIVKRQIAYLQKLLRTPFPFAPNTDEAFELTMHIDTALQGLFQDGILHRSLYDDIGSVGQLFEKKIQENERIEQLNTIIEVINQGECLTDKQLVSFTQIIDGLGELTTPEVVRSWTTRLQNIILEQIGCWTAFLEDLDTPLEPDKLSQAACILKELIYKFNLPSAIPDIKQPLETLIEKRSDYDEDLEPLKKFDSVCISLMSFLPPPELPLTRTAPKVTVADTSIFASSRPEKKPDGRPYSCSL